MSRRWTSLLPWLGWPLLHALLFGAFLLLSLPTESLRHRLLVELNARKPLGDARIEIESLELWRLSGISLSGVRVTGTEKADDGKTDRAHALGFDRVRARVALLPLLLGRFTVLGDATGLGGRLEAAYREKGGDQSLEARLEGIGLSEVPGVSDLLGLPLGGTLDGTLAVTLPEGRLTRAEGSLALTVTDLFVGDGKAKVRGTLALPRLEVGKLELQASLGEGRLKLEKLETQGASDVELSGQGGIRLREPFSTSLSELQLRIKFSERYTDKNDVTRALFGAPGSKVSGLFDMDPKIRRAKRPDGSYHWRATGPLSSMGFEPAPQGGAPLGAAGRERALPRPSQRPAAP